MTGTTQSATTLPKVLTVAPSISEKPTRAIAALVLIHGPLDMLTAYGMMATRRPSLEGNPLVAWAFQFGLVPYVLFTAAATVILGGLMWNWRESLWSNPWAPVVTELMIIAGTAFIAGNVLSMTGEI